MCNEISHIFHAAGYTKITLIGNKLVTNIFHKTLFVILSVCIPTIIVLFMFSTAYASEINKQCSCGEQASNRSIDEVLACFNDTRCENEKIDLAVALRAKGRNLATAMESYLQLTNNPLLSEKEKQDYLDKIQYSRKQLIAIKKSIDFQGYDYLIEPLYLDFDYPDKAFHRNYFSFNLGYEYVSIDDIFQKGFPRIGFLLYRRYGETPVKTEGLNYYGLHLAGAMQLTSSGEQNTTQDNNELKNTLEVSAIVFVPVFHSLINSDRSLSDFTGPILSYSAKKTEDIDRVNSKLYFGARNAYNPETYVDILFGKTQGLDSQRMEIRAHLPVYKFVHGSRIFIGGILNMSAPWDVSKDENDAIRFYLEWNADFGKLLEGIKSAFGV